MHPLLIVAIVVAVIALALWALCKWAWNPTNSYASGSYYQPYFSPQYIFTIAKEEEELKRQIKDQFKQSFHPLVIRPMAFETTKDVYDQVLELMLGRIKSRFRTSSASISIGKRYANCAQFVFTAPGFVSHIRLLDYDDCDRWAKIGVPTDVTDKIFFAMQPIPVEKEEPKCCKFCGYGYCQCLPAKCPHCGSPMSGIHPASCYDKFPSLTKCVCHGAKNNPACKNEGCEMHVPFGAVNREIRIRYPIIEAWRTIMQAAGIETPNNDMTWNKFYEYVGTYRKIGKVYIHLYRNHVGDVVGMRPHEGAIGKRIGDEYRAWRDFEFEAIPARDIIEIA